MTPMIRILVKHSVLEAILIGVRLIWKHPKVNFPAAIMSVRRLDPSDGPFSIFAFFHKK